MFVHFEQVVSVSLLVLMFLLSGVCLFGLVNIVECVEAWAEQFLLSLTAATSHGFDGIQPDVFAVSHRC
jgi:hypothetical protein